MTMRFRGRIGMVALAAFVAVVALAAVSLAATGKPSGGSAVTAGQVPAGAAGHCGAYGPGLQVVAGALGMTADQYLAARQAGKSVEAIAQEKGMDLATVIQKVVDARKPALEQLVANGTITREEMDLSLKLMAVRLERDFKDPAISGGRGNSGPGGIGTMAVCPMGNGSGAMMSGCPMGDGRGAMMSGGCPMMGGATGGYGF